MAVVGAAGLSFGFASVVGETFAESDSMKTEELKKGAKAMMKDDKMMKQDDSTMMQKKQ